MKPANLIIRMILAAVWTLGELCLAANAAPAASQSPNMSEEDIKYLIVMIDASLNGGPSRGAGIICGAGSDTLYIVTANHVVRKGEDEAEEIQIHFKWLPGKTVKATLLRQRDTELDLAVLRMTGFSQLGINIEDLPFDRLGSPSSLQRGDDIYLLGYPGGRPWRVNTTPEKFAEARGDSLEFESNLITGGHSGGALLDENRDLVGMLRSDTAPYGEAIRITSIINRLREWGYPVDLGQQITPTRFSGVSAGYSRVCGINATGKAYCWGEVGTYNGIDKGKNVFTEHPTRVQGGLTFQTLSATGVRVCGVTAEGAAYCWGAGPLGDGLQSDSFVPVSVSGGLLFQSVTVSGYEIWGLTREGKVYRWGLRGDRVPEPDSPEYTFRSITADGESVCGSLTTGIVKCNGDNGGWGRINVRFQSLAGGCALTPEGAAYCLGKMDTGSSKRSEDVALVPGRLVFQLISADDEQACGVTLDGAGYCWGRRHLGNGTENGSAVPVPVSGGLKFRSVSVGGPTCGLTTEGKVYCWGSSYENVRGVEIYQMEYGTVPKQIPGNAYTVSVRLINTLRQERNFAKAWAEADAALKQYPNERAIKRVHALVLGDLGKTGQALIEMRNLLNGEKDRETNLAIANICKRAKNYNEMEKSLQLAEQLSQTKEEQEAVSFERADAYSFHMHKYEEAEREYHKILKTNPGSARALNNLGYMLAERNVRLEEARELISHAVKVSPQNGAYLDSLGLVYDRLGQLDEAESHLHLAWEVSASDATISEHLADVYFKKGKVKEAIVLWRDALNEYETRAPIDIEPTEVARIRKKLETAGHP